MYLSGSWKSWARVANIFNDIMPLLASCKFFNYCESSFIKMHFLWLPFNFGPAFLTANLWFLYSYLAGIYCAIYILESKNILLSYCLFLRPHISVGPDPNHGSLGLNLAQVLHCNQLAASSLHIQK